MLPETLRQSEPGRTPLSQTILTTGISFIDRIGSTEGCKKTQNIIYMGVAADCEYVKHYGSTASATTTILNNWNTASSLYKSTFNVSLGIVQLSIQDVE